MARSIRCTAHRRDGQPCQKWAILGGTVCPTHGGRAPQVKRAAQARAAPHASRAIAVLGELLGSERDAVRLTAAQEILDRAGLPRSRPGPGRDRRAGATQSAPAERDAKLDAEIEETMQRILRSRDARARVERATSMGRDFDGSNRAVPESSESVPGEEAP